LVHVGLIEVGVVADFLFAEPGDDGVAEQEAEQEGKEDGGGDLEGEEFVEDAKKAQAVGLEELLVALGEELNHFGFRISDFGLEGRTEPVSRLRIRSPQSAIRNIMTRPF